MKSLLFHRIVFLLIIAAGAPMALMAAPAAFEKPMRRNFAALTIFQDSTASKKKTSNKPREVQKTPNDGIEDRLREAQRRSIKEVPRSLPKLKPQPVSERAKIYRQPVKRPRN